MAEFSAHNVHGLGGREARDHSAQRFLNRPYGNCTDHSLTSDQSSDHRSGWRGHGRGDCRSRGRDRGRGQGRGRGRGRGRGQRHDQDYYHHSFGHKFNNEGDRGAHGRVRQGHQSCLRRWKSTEALGATYKTECNRYVAGREHRQAYVERPMGVKKLCDLAEKKRCEEISLELTSSRSGFELLIKSDVITPDCFDILLQVLEKVCKSVHRQNVLHILSLLCASTFIEKHIMKFLTDGLRTTFSTDMVAKLNRILFLFDNIHQRLPSSAEKCTGVLLVMKSFIDVHKLSSVEPEVEQKRAALVDMCKKAALLVKEPTKFIQQRHKRREAPINADDDAPPNDFRVMRLFPDIKDLQLNTDVFLRKNKDEGAYADLNTYLDVQFRLLREDYIQPLRKGIQEYRNCLRKGETPKKLSDLRLYCDVQIIGSVCNEDVETRLKFDTTYTSKIRWQSSKRLIYGSLVGLTKDDFETIIFATVTYRNVEDLERGIIQVRFENNFDLIRRASPQDMFTMAETTAYFEAYKHVLCRLQQIGADMPFQKYILHCKTWVGPPKYLTESKNPRYNMQALADISSGKFSGLQSVPVLKTVVWPDLSCFNLDSTQLDAVKTALTKELAIVQGPPGTGKTYVGLKIAQVLFANRHIWAREEAFNGILVVCYTNHALDQFLEGIAHFMDDGIVRVGGRSSSEKMKKFNLKQLRVEVRDKKLVRKSIFVNSLDCKKVMSKLREDIEEVSSRIEASSVGILHEKELQQIINEEQYDSLVKSNKSNSKNAAMNIWLGFGTTYAENENDQGKQFMIDQWVKVILKSIDCEQTEQNNSYTDEESVLTLKLAERVRLYRQWVLRFRSHMIKKIADATNDDVDYKTENPQLQGLQIKLESSNKWILSDLNLRPFVPKHIFNVITTGEYSQVKKGYAFQTWLGVSQLLSEDDLVQAVQELEADINNDYDDEQNGIEEEADITTAHRFVDDQDSTFKAKTGPSSLLLNKAMKAVVVSMTSFGQDCASVKDNGEWEVQTQRKKRMKKQLEAVLQNKHCMTEKEVDRVRNVWSLTNPDRIKLYRSWVLKYQHHLRTSIQEKEIEYHETAKRLKEVLLEEDRDILENAMVIGMTTTGAAKHAALLQIVAPRIIIVEEAAEVLESHIITTLNPKCQHLILIGDHQQLRPNPTVYDLAKTYNLDISLFERLIKNEMHHVTLSLQHRMRPEISILMKHIYPNLMDHDSVLGHPKILGIEKNIFFVHHEHQEQHQDETKSRTNEHEASYIVALCRYLILQGYKPSDITILAAYTGQILLIKRHMTKMNQLLKGVRLTSVDNYQGEENKIILLSLVRSNEEGSVGFLGIGNRVCVALSRAKEGLYAIGNFKLLAQKSTLWKNIVKTLTMKKHIGLSLLLQCQNHPKRTIDASKSADFDKVPDGGCNQPCDLRLPCGHVCGRVCHISDRNHVGFKCRMPCERPHSNCKHPCPKKCSEKCSNCQVLVSKTIPMCGHKDNVPCFEDPHAWDCTQTCQGTLMCGHKCRGKCGTCRKGGHSKLCKEIEEMTLPCGHNANIPCFTDSKFVTCTNTCQSTLICGHKCKGKCGVCRKEGHKEPCLANVIMMWPCGHEMETECHKSKLTTMCIKPCTKILDCGHQCNGSCGKCMYGRIHESCSTNCTRKLPCSHVCKQACGAECLPCTLQCTKKCSHSTCSERCGQVCQPCKELCLGGCSHTTCTKVCSEMCNSEMCNVPCNKTLSPCGHKCIGVCGESCLCKECNAGGLKSSKSLPSEEEETFIMLKACGHIFSRDYLDIWMKSVKYATMPVCPEPKCQKVITESVRYAKVFRKAFQEIQDQKEKLLVKTEKLDERASTLKQQISSSSLPSATIRQLTGMLERNLTLDTVNAIENQFSMVLDIYNVHVLMSDSFLQSSDLAQELKEVQMHLLQDKDFMSDQMIREYRTEIQRLTSLIKQEKLVLSSM